MPIKAVVLDVGGVLLLPHGSLVADRLEAAGIAFTPAYDEAHYRGVRALDREASGPDPWGTYVDGYVAALGVRPEDRTQARSELRPLWHGGEVDVWSFVVATSVTGLEALRDRGVPLAIVSNSDGSVARRLVQHEICQVDEGPGVGVATVVDSGVVGVAKPDPAIFAFALEGLGLPADAVAYVGDSVTFDVVGARRAGLVPFHLDPYDLCEDASHRHLHRVADVAEQL